MRGEQGGCHGEALQGLGAGGSAIGGGQVARGVQPLREQERQQQDIAVLNKQLS